MNFKNNKNQNLSNMNHKKNNKKTKNNKQKIKLFSILFKKNNQLKKQIIYKYKM